MEFLKDSIHFPSADGQHQCAGYFYQPADRAPKAVIQLSHGMCEYVCRYEPMIARLCAAGYAVCGNDHLGHGDTSPESYGFFAESGGDQLVLKDLKTMNNLAHQRFPGLPLILLGHSMGSFFARWFAEKHPQNISALVISGTGGPGVLMEFGEKLAAFLTKVRGPRHVSPFLVKVSTGSYCKGIEGNQSGSAWLSRDPQVWAAYDGDPKCSFSFTVSAYRDMLTAYNHVNTAQWAARISQDIPILIYSGDQDPVGNYGKGVRAVYGLLMSAGHPDVTLRLYPGGRHEMHNETNKDEVFRDLIAWCDEHI
jgi:alpha-beta hydrolase superfamily lysophospholipase